jgi:hypothetical protein
MMNETDTSNRLADVVRFYQGCLNEPVPMEFLTQHGLMDSEMLSRLEVGYSTGGLMKTLSSEQQTILSEFGLINGKRETLRGTLVFPCRNDGRVTGFLGIGIPPEYNEVCVLPVAGGLVGESVLDVYRDEILVAENLREFLALLRLGFQNTFLIHPGMQAEALLALHRHRVKRAIAFRDNGLEELLLQAVPEVEHRDASISFSSTVEEIRVSGTVRKAKHGDSAASLTNGESRQNEGSLVVEKHRDSWTARRGSLSYRMTGMKPGFTTTVRVSLRAEKNGKRHVDTVDLLSARQRKSYCQALSEATGEEPGTIEQDLLFLLDRLEEDEARRDVGGPEDSQPMTPEQERIGMAFLRSPELLDAVANDLDVLGYAGEEANKQVAYLVATSRLQDDPLNMLLVSGSGAGKSALIDSVKKLIPPSEVVSLTSLSDQALNYLEPAGLLHKLVTLGESVHGETVNHQLREIVSSKELSRMVVSREERTGRQVSRIVRTPTVVSLMMSTTHRNHNPENLSRYLMLHADESQEQTARIHRVQNSRLSLESLRATEELVPAVIEKHYAAQRLLQPVKVVAPEGLAWDLPVQKLRTRRDNQALNSLMVTLCFLRQYQKQRKVHDGLTYIECDAYDRETAWKLFSTAVMPATYQEYPEAMARLYETVRSFCTARAAEAGVPVLDVVFDQRAIRKVVNWISGESVKLYFRKLIELEHIVLKSGGNQGQRKTYSLAEDAGWQELEGGANGT